VSYCLIMCPAMGRAAAHGRTIDIDVRGLEARTLLESKRLAYSTANAINRTMLEIQREERAELDRRFTIRYYAAF
jgi:hypothetical protein